VLFRSVVVSGPPGAGKTSMLSALLDACPPTRCIRCCEEVRELHIPLVHGSFYEARPPGLDGTGEISLRVLVKAVLAMRPDLIVVGEVRGAEAFELTRAVNAGCGFACTIHADSASAALVALVNAALMAGENVTEAILTRVFRTAIDFVVHLRRDQFTGDQAGIRRQVMEILALDSGHRSGGFATEPLFLRSDIAGTLEWTGVLPPTGIHQRLERSLPDGAGIEAILSGSWEPSP